ncbi:tyrosine-protein kinase CSK-like isoform X2 [Convolutriloba macropyga]|uniref:tyrosine-protein kinase CSK-like isoform X2 n=1 Tax=Convolutriloba macropyga TaxID=536237 RepID=UPI003F5243BD
MSGALASAVDGGAIAAKWKENSQAVVQHDFLEDAIDSRDLRLKQGDVIVVVKVTKDQNWIKAKSLDGREGLVPVNYIKRRDPVKLHSYVWFHGKIERETAEELLKSPPLVNGKYLVRESIRYEGDFTLSLLTVSDANEPIIDHYRMSRDSKNGKIYIDEEHQFEHIIDVISFYRKEACGLAYKLTRSVDTNEAKIRVIKSDFEKCNWRISRAEVHLKESIGSGEFAEVFKGTFRKAQVAVKKIKRQGQEESEKILAEACIMTSLKHPNLLRLIGVVTDDPIMMLVEYCDKGSLLDVLRTQGRQVITLTNLLDFAKGVLDGMWYLECKNLQHRDLACRNVLIDDSMQAKICDFGLAQNRTATLESAKFPIKWSAPEAVNEKKYTNKSDVWSYGVFLWELFSYGRVPYPSMQKDEVVKHVMRGYRMQCPPDCPEEIYKMMLKCWTIEVNDRPSFRTLKETVLTDELIKTLKANDHTALQIHSVNLGTSENNYESLDSM